MYVVERLRRPWSPPRGWARTSFDPHFGQTPSQLFTKPHPQRPLRDFRGGSRIVADPLADLRVYRPSNKKKEVDKSALSMLNLPGRALIKLMMTSSSKLMGLRRDGTITFYQWLNTNISSNSGIIPFSCGIEKEKKIQLERLKCNFDLSLSFNILTIDLFLKISWFYRPTRPLTKNWKLSSTLLKQWETASNRRILGWKAQYSFRWSRCDCRELYKS